MPDYPQRPRFAFLKATQLPALGSALLVFALILGATYFVHDNLRRQQHQEQRAAALIEGALVRSHIETEINTRLVQSRGLAAYVASHPNINGNEFNEIGRLLVSQQPNIHSIQLAPHNVVSYIYPQAGNEKARGLNLLHQPMQRSLVEQAMRSGKTMVAGPLQLVQGGQAVIGRTPIFLSRHEQHESGQTGAYWGMANVLMNVDALFDDTTFKGTSGQFEFAVRGADGLGANGGPVWGNVGLFANDPVLLDITLPDGSWQLATVPASGWQQSHNEVLWAAGLAFSILAGCFVWFVMNSPLKLRAHVDKATAALKKSRKEISQINRELEQRVIARTQDLAIQYAFSQALIRAQSEIDEGVLVVENGRVVFANEALARICGYSVEEITGGMSFIELFHPKVREEIMDRHRRRIAGEFIEKRYDTLFQTREHRTVDIELSVVLIPAPPQTRVVIVARDISAAKTAARALQARAKAFEAAGEMIVITDLRGNIEYANRAFFEQTGYSPEETIGFQVATLINSGVHEQQFFTDMWETILAGRIWRGEITNRRKNGSRFTAAQVIAPLTDEDGNVTGFVSVKHDISERKRLEAKLSHMAHYDELTGLPNRSLLFDRLHQTLARAQRNDEAFALLFIDLDGFKLINDSCGHETGDALLAEVASRITFCIRSTDTAARIGGDEFTVIITDLQHTGDAERIAAKLTQALSQPFELGAHECTISASIGISLYPEHGNDVEALLKRADNAMYHAKKGGKNDWQLFRDGPVGHA
jgi:diguanylate cyclase (GGDEF)-like protein/PAS domain S-box-containing protein